ncbi:substrate-binding periplasmic protein [Atopomonas sediminilitoris]|uniref:substrate-binding periplasmic protein n=1 Tax=Atopomonas sediminilitoris TaxID=2919919 RepID=UPI001F4E61A4|nr:transporter substrate-binding domain-containing protein [Atopomonas sediminilitoris]MCJ8169377.1 transporter substrate-binding domain-containing protein [Atopomonas sediminilitoris]
MRRRSWILGWLCLAPLAWADTPPLHLVTADGPPHMQASSGTGLDIDIARAALARAGRQITLEFMPLNRAFASLQDGKADLMLPYFNAPQAGLYLSQPYLQYRPAVFMQDHGGPAPVQQLADLAQFRIATFQGARGYFGEVFVRASEQAPDYSEVQNMASLVDMLAYGRVQVVVLDEWIFQHYYREKRHTFPHRVLSHVIPAVPAVAVFKDATLRDAFNRGLALLQDNGEYEALLAYYRR